MAKPKNSFEVMAREGAERIAKARAAGEQLAFLPDEDGSAIGGAGGAGPGRPKGAKGKVSNQMRDWLSAKGYRMPEEMLAEMAGLSSQGDPVLVAMEKAEMLLAWAFDGATRRKKGGSTEEVRPSGAVRLNAVMQVLAIQLRSADALLPYGAPKATPDAAPIGFVPVLMPGTSAGPRPAGQDARDVTPKPARIASPPLPWQIQRNQEVSEVDATSELDAKSDGDASD